MFMRFPAANAPLLGRLDVKVEACIFIQIHKSKAPGVYTSGMD
jgi:hypothetical protein